MKRPFLMAMMSWILVSMTGMIALGAGITGPHPAIVRIMALEQDGASFGSGTLVAVNDSHGLVVTNWHVVRDATGPITVFFPDSFHSGATVLRTDRDWDLAALAIWKPRAMPVTVSKEAPQPGEVLTIAGYGSGEFRAVAGRCTQYVSPGGNHPYEMVELDAPARNGDSGGPILNSRGELAGVLFGSAFGRTTGSYSGRLRWFLNSVISDFHQMPTPAMLAQQQLQGGTQGTPPSTTTSLPQPLQQEDVHSSSLTSQAVAQLASPPPRPSPMTSIPFSGEPATSNASTATNASKAIAPSQLSNAAGHAASSDIAQKSSLQTVAPANMSPANKSSSGEAAKTLVSVPFAQPSLPSIDQLRTIFSAIGVLAVLYMALRLLGSAVG